MNDRTWKPFGWAKKAKAAAVLILLGAAFAPLSCAAQQPSAPQQPEAQATLRMEVRRVLLRVLVKDKRSHQGVTGLAAQDFLVKDDGVERPLTYFGAGPSRDRPLTVVLLLDIRILNKHRIQTLASSADAAFATLGAADRVGLWTMDQGDGQELQPATTDKATVKKAIAQLGETPLKSPQLGSGPVKALEAILASLHGLAADSDVIVVPLTDDLDAEPNPRIEAIRKGLLATPGVLYLLYKADRKEKWMRKFELVAAPGGFSPGLPGFRYQSFSYLAQQTGGDFVEVSGDDYGRGLIQMFSDIAASYLLEFRPASSAADGKFHALSVSLRKGALKQGDSAKVIYRKGYYDAEAR